MWRSFVNSIYHAVSSVQNWLCGTYTSLMNLMILVMGATWGNAYLESVHHLSRTEASIATMMIYIGTIIGSPAVAPIATLFPIKTFFPYFTFFLKFVFFISLTEESKSSVIESG